MQISHQADYAIRTIQYLSKKGLGNRVTTAIVASEMNIPSAFLTKIIAQLVIAGLLHTIRGSHGGISLTRDPKEISLLNVVEAIDGPIQLNECVGTNNTCTFVKDCLVYPIWLDAQKSLEISLRDTCFNNL
jgi:Rrf2 family protein